LGTVELLILCFNSTLPVIFVSSSTPFFLSIHWLSIPSFPLGSAVEKRISAEHVMQPAKIGLAAISRLYGLLVGIVAFYKLTVVELEYDRQVRLHRYKLANKTGERTQHTRHRPRINFLTQLPCFPKMRVLVLLFPRQTNTLASAGHLYFLIQHERRVVVITPSPKSSQEGYDEFVLASPIATGISQQRTIPAMFHHRYRRTPTSWR
jgi:hypothetical protein